MTPSEWIELIRKDLADPEKTTEAELAKLRSNYVIWREGVEYVKLELQGVHRQILKKAVGYRTLIQEDYEALFRGEKIDVLSDEQYEAVRAELERYYPIIGIAIGRAKQIRFFQKFDEEFKNETGSDAPEIVEAVWKDKAMKLAKAIEEHRYAHVLANKEANGLDFKLWAVVDLDEFHPSRHHQVEVLGFIPEKG